MSTRPTPFGAFAGVSLVSLVEQTTATLCTPNRAITHTRPDMHWLMAFLQQIEHSREIMSFIPMMTSQYAHVVGERVYLASMDIYGQKDQRPLSLRATPLVLFLLEEAHTPLFFSELANRGQQAFPLAPREKIEKLLWQLWDARLFVSTLHPPGTSSAPAYYVLEHLQNIPEAQEYTTTLNTVLQDVSALDRCGFDESAPLMHALLKYMEKSIASSSSAKSEKNLPIQVDTSLCMRSHELHSGVGKAAEQAAELLLRLGTLPQGLPHLSEYRHTFITRYGDGAEVPILDLLSAENGLDAPSGYQYPPRNYPLPDMRRATDSLARTTYLCHLMTRAINERVKSIVLSDQDISRLEQWSPRTQDAPLSLDIYLQVHASSMEALDKGDWIAVVSPNCGAPSGLRSFGRFADMLGSHVHETLQAFLAQEEALLPDAIFAELSYQAHIARTANVAIRPALRKYEIAVGTTPSVTSERTIRLEDLVVGVYNDRFYVRSLAHGKEVIVCQMHMLSPNLAPNVCRFLLEIAQDRKPCLMPFDWGVLQASPFLPRLVYQQIVLSPASWTLSASEQLDAGNERTWFAHLQDYRSSWHIPQHVYVVESDNRLLLDLEHPLMIEELRSMLKEAARQARGPLVLQEVLPDLDHLWLRDTNDSPYFSEVVVPVVRTASSSPLAAPLRPNTQKRAALPHVSRCVFPGDEWIYVKMYGGQREQTPLLTTHAIPFLQRLQHQGHIDRWFFVRYADPEPHIRLRMRATSKAVLTPLAALLEWCKSLIVQGTLVRYSLDTFEREVERFGGPQAVEAVEQLFWADSAYVGAVLDAQERRSLPLDSTLIAVYSLHKLTEMWGLDTRGQLEWLRSFTDAHTGKDQFRGARHTYCKLLSSSPHDHDLPFDSTKLTQEEHVGHQLLHTLFLPYATHFQHVGASIRALAAEEMLWVSEDDLLRSIVHMHMNRLSGSRIEEARAYANWRHTLESLRSRALSRANMSV